jgi:hypothetical protein
MIPKSQHQDSFGVKELCSRSIMFLTRAVVVTATIYFDREAHFRTIEVHNVTIDEMLPSKFVPCKVPISKASP